MRAPAPDGGRDRPADGGCDGARSASGTSARVKPTMRALGTSGCSSAAAAAALCGSGVALARPEPGRFCFGAGSSGISSSSSSSAEKLARSSSPRSISVAAAEALAPPVGCAEDRLPATFFTCRANSSARMRWRICVTHSSLDCEPASAGGVGVGGAGGGAGGSCLLGGGCGTYTRERSRDGGPRTGARAEEHESWLSEHTLLGCGVLTFDAARTKALATFARAAACEGERDFCSRRPAASSRSRSMAARL
mmetsp:Transcript_31270/g.72756  ORF Transcript_31270/g.72756 Transcript_31270/m.72756 type:complete len:251 (-) Transcript_31270:1261-2013(-)